MEIGQLMSKSDGETVKPAKNKQEKLISGAQSLTHKWSCLPSPRQSLWEGKVSNYVGRWKILQHRARVCRVCFCCVPYALLEWKCWLAVSGRMLNSNQIKQCQEEWMKYREIVLRIKIGRTWLKYLALILSILKKHSCLHLPSKTCLNISKTSRAMQRVQWLWRSVHKTLVMGCSLTNHVLWGRKKKLFAFKITSIEQVSPKKIEESNSTTLW